MRFKIIGLLFLAIATYLAVQAFDIAVREVDPTDAAKVYALLAVFMVLVARVLQAEKHHRDLMPRKKVEEEPASPQPELLDDDGKQERVIHNNVA